MHEPGYLALEISEEMLKMSSDFFLMLTTNCEKREMN